MQSTKPIGRTSGKSNAAFFYKNVSDTWERKAEKKGETILEEQRYCAGCRRIEAAAAETCTLCGGALRQAEASDWVFLVTAEPDDVHGVEELLKREEIPFETKDQPLPPDGSIYSGRGLLPPKDFFVRYADWEKADKLLTETFAKNAQETEEMPMKKRMLVQILSVLLFILLIGGVVYAADWIAELIKSLF